MKYARECTFCLSGMNEGYVSEMGYFCSDSCKDTYLSLTASDDNYGINEPYGGLTEEEVLEQTIVFDNEGETFDRYTIFLPNGEVYGMCHDAKGFNQYVGDSSSVKQGSHLGIKLDAVPSEIKYAVLGRMLEGEEQSDEDDIYWTQWDDDFFNDSFYFQLEFKYNDKLFLFCICNGASESDFWETVTINDVTFDVHYCEEDNEVYVYLANSNFNCIHRQKINEDETSN